MTGVLNGASTVFLTTPPPNVTSYDVFLTTAGDVLIATGVSAPRTPRARRAGRVHFARGPDNRRRVWPVRRGDRHDDIRRCVSHAHCPADRRSHLTREPSAVRMSKATGTEPAAEALQSLTVDAPGYAAYRGASLGSVGFGCKHDQIERPAARESNGDEMAHIARGDPHRRRATRPARNRWSTWVKRLG